MNAFIRQQWTAVMVWILAAELVVIAMELVYYGAL